MTLAFLRWSRACPGKPRASATDRLADVFEGLAQDAVDRRAGEPGGPRDRRDLPFLRPQPPDRPAKWAARLGALSERSVPGHSMRNGERLGEAALFPGRRSLRGVEHLGLSRSSRVRSAGTRSTRSGRFQALFMVFDSMQSVRHLRGFDSGVGSNAGNTPRCYSSVRASSIGWVQPNIGSGLSAGGLHPPYKWVETACVTYRGGLRAGSGRSVRLKPDLLSDR